VGAIYLVQLEKYNIRTAHVPVLWDVLQITSNSRIAVVQIAVRINVQMVKFYLPLPVVATVLIIVEIGHNCRIAPVATVQLPVHQDKLLTLTAHALALFLALVVTYNTDVAALVPEHALTKVLPTARLSSVQQTIHHKFLLELWQSKLQTRLTLMV